MGIWSGAKKTVGAIINIRVDRWIGTHNLKDGWGSITSGAKSVFTTSKAEVNETFEEALDRLNITEEDLKQRKKEFTKLFIFYAIFALLLFIYALYLLVIKSNIGGTVLTTSLMLYCLVNVFRFHFWLYQINHKKLGCSISEWLNG